jgi:hypothetical protein
MAQTTKEDAMRLLLAAAIAAGAALLIALPAMATTGKGQLFHDGTVVGTVVTPSPIAAGSGTDPFYNVTNGAAGQLGIAGVAPVTGPTTVAPGRSTSSHSTPESRPTSSPPMKR